MAIPLSQKRSVRIVRGESQSRASHIDARLCDTSVFIHQGGDSGAFPILKRLNDGMVVQVGVAEPVVHAGQVHLVERYGMGGRKGDATVALNCLRDYLAPRPLDDQRMELPVHVAVTRFVSLHQMSLGKNRVAFAEALLQ